MRGTGSCRSTALLGGAQLRPVVVKGAAAAGVCMARCIEIKEFQVEDRAAC